MARLPQFDSARIDRFAWVILTVACVGIAFAMRGYTFDDAYITFRAARNFADGHGLVFNPGERYQTTSAPGYALLLAAFCRVFGPGPVPGLATLLSATGLLGGATALYEIGRSRNSRIAGLLAGLFFALSLSNSAAFTNETLPQVALILWGFALILRGNTLASSWLLLAATLMRPDGLMAAAIGLVAMHYVAKRLLWRETAILVCGIGLAALALYLSFGYILPTTMEAKQAQVIGREGQITPFLEGLSGFFRTATGYYSESGFVQLAGLFFCVLLMLNRYWLPVAAWATCHLVFYAYHRIAFYHWYAVAPGVGLSVAAGLLPTGTARLGTSGALHRALVPLTWLLVVGFIGWLVMEGFDYFRFGQFVPATLAASIAAALVAAYACFRFASLLPTLALRVTPEMVTKLTYAVAAVWTAVFALAEFRQVGTSILAGRDAAHSDKIALYQSVGRWLDTHLPPGSRVGYSEIGIVGWEAPHISFIDPLGLGSPHMLSNVRRGRALQNIVDANPDAVIIYPPLTGLMRDRPSTFFPPNQTTPYTNFQAYLAGMTDWLHGKYHVEYRDGPCEVWVRNRQQSADESTSGG
ncbi:MAG: hypothetical protein JSS72_04815 [Armatimonadetes bacterium]|nr:hypothetical protein [Armatimonadota bacterium]